MFMFRADVWCLYYIIIYYILYYTLLFPSHPNLSTSSQSPLPFLLSQSPPLLPLLFQYSSLYHPIISSSSHTILLFSLTILINHYIRVDTYIRLFILYYSILLSSPLSSTPLPPHPISSSFLYLSPIHSIRVGTYIYLFIFRGDSWDGNSTPHKLTDGNVEWCSLISMWCSVFSW